MTTTAPDGPRLLDPGRLRFAETDPPAFEEVVEQRIRAAWDAAVAVNPHLFDGPVVACTGVGTDADGVVVRWAPTTFRRYAGRRNRSLPYVACLWDGVVLTDEDGRVLVGRTASWTATPGRWQLPGGNVEPPSRAAGTLAAEAVRAHAALELREETGVDVEPSGLTPLCVLTYPTGDTGVVYRTDGHRAADVEARFADLVAHEQQAGGVAEFDRIAWIRGVSDLHGEPGTIGGYLDLLLAATS